MRPRESRRPDRRGGAVAGAILAAFVVTIPLAMGCARPDDAARGGIDSLERPVAVDTTTATRATVPTSKPDIHGVVTAVEGVRIRVEEDPHQASGSNKASLRIEPSTVVMRRTGEVASASDLRLGARVSAWYEGPVMESYPVQALARAIVIEPDSL